MVKFVAAMEFFSLAVLVSAIFTGKAAATERKIITLSTILTESNLYTNVLLAKSNFYLFVY